MNKKYIKVLSITFMLAIGMLGVVNGFSETDDTKTSTVSKECDHKDAEKCEKHSAQKCNHAGSQDTNKSGSCCKAKTAEAKSCDMKSEKKCTKSIEGSNKTI